MIIKSIKNIVFNSIIFIFLNISYISAQNKNIKFEHLTVENGLSQSTIICILKDSQGFMWFGTDNGLNKYDGYEFIIYQHNHKDTSTISGNSIACLLEDYKGNLWIGTFSNGLNLFDKEKETFTHFNTYGKNKRDISNNSIGCLFEDTDKNLWIGTFGGGLNLFDRKTNSFTKYKHDTLNVNSIATNYISSIAQDSKGNIWLANNYGHLISMKTKGHFSNFKYDKNHHGQLSSVDFGSITIDKNDNIWIGTENGIYIYNISKNSFKHIVSNSKDNTISNNAITGIFEDENEIFWITTDHGGVNIFDSKNNKFDYLIDNQFDKTSLSNSQILNIYKDVHCNYWFGSYKGGINVYYKNKYKFKTYLSNNENDNSLSFSSVLVFLEDKQGNIWIGTDGYGLNLFDPQTKNFKHFKHDPKDNYSISSNIVTTIFEDQSGDLWIGTYHAGLNFFDRKNNKFIRFSHNPNDENSLSHNNVWAIIEDSYNDFWIGTNEGINKYDRKNKVFEHYKHDPNNIHSISDNYINLIFEDSKQNLWFGTPINGANKYNRKTNNFDRYIHNSKDTNNLINNKINVIYEDTKGYIWFGTSDGLSYINTENHLLINFTKDNGLPDNEIKSILEDNDSNFWIGTDKGLSKFNFANKTFKNYTVSDGLPSNEFNTNSCLLSKSGQIYFGGPKGFSSFFPDSIKKNKNIPQIVFSNFYIFTKPVVIGAENSPLQKHINESDTIILSYEQSVFTIKYAALNFISSEKNQFAYKLDNFDDKWRYVGNERKATYTNLDPGKYTFKVKASNNDDLWNEKGISITIIITPPWWKTLLFRITLVIIIISLIIGFYIYRLRNFKHQKLNLENEVTNRTNALKKSNCNLEEIQEAILQQNTEIQTQYKEINSKNQQLKEQKSEIEKAYTTLQVLSEFGQNLTATLNLNAINDMIYDYVNSIINIDAFGIGVYNLEERCIYYPSFFEYGVKNNPYYKSIYNTNSLSVFCFNNQKTVLINDFDNEITQYISTFTKKDNSKYPQSLIRIPLTVDHKHIGVLTANCFKNNSFSNTDLSRLQSLASYISIALDNANVYRIVETQNKNIKSSIRYAQTIQQAILPSTEILNKYFDTFVIYHPKDIVSGDFYWTTKVDNIHTIINKKQSTHDYIFVGVFDCTGHGVPGAFMSMIGNTLLNNIIIEKKIYDPKTILELMHQGIYMHLKQSSTKNDDGMDVCLCRIKRNNKSQKNKNSYYTDHQKLLPVEYTVTYAGAKRPLFYYDNTDKSLSVIKGSLNSTGGRYFSKDHPFKNSEIKLNKGDTIYLTSDGFVDQPNIKHHKFGIKKFKALLTNVANLPIKSQTAVIEAILDEHKQKAEQRDDITILGIKL